MTDFRDTDYRDTEVKRDENGLIIMESERRVEPPPKTGGLAGIIFAGVLLAVGVAGYAWYQSAPQTALTEPAVEAPRQFALNDAPPVVVAPTPEAAPTPEPSPRRARSAPVPAPQPQAAAEPAPVEPMAPPPPIDMLTPQTGQ